MAKKISFASFNLYNFQEPGKKVYFKEVTQEEYDKKLEWTQKYLLNLDADVIIFQELWAKKCLEDAFDHPALSDYELVFVRDDKPWYGIAVAVAVRRGTWSIEQKTIHKEFPFENLLLKEDEGDGEDDELNLDIKRFSRAIIQLRLKYKHASGITPVELFAAHFKSKRPVNVKLTGTDKYHCASIGSALSTIRRTAEAAAARYLVTNTLKKTHTPVVFVGDLNDDPRSNTVSILTEQPSFSYTAKGSDSALYSALQMQQIKSFRDTYYTHIYRDLKDTLDHILVSEQFFGPSKDAQWVHDETRIWNDYLEDDRKETTDHGLMRATFHKK